jgi:hypothetical protein
MNGDADLAADLLAEFGDEAPADALILDDDGNIVRPPARRLLETGPEAGRLKL